MISIELTRECPLRCPGCYAYEDMHLGLPGVTLRQLADFKGSALVQGVLRLVDKHRPLHVSLVGGDPLVRYRELDELLPELDRRGIIVVETQLDRANQIVRVIVADNGPGIPAAEREKLFLPYYSTKRRGSGLGLAIVRRVIAEHGGSIDVTDNHPRGTRFTIELPC